MMEASRLSNHKFFGHPSNTAPMYSPHTMSLNGLADKPFQLVMLWLRASPKRGGSCGLGVFVC